MNFIEKIIEDVSDKSKLKFRFPPEPNSSLHIGHAKSIILNFGLSKKYGVPCVLRFDDTNPNTEKSEFIDSMIKDIMWLGYKPDDITYASDYFDSIIGVALHLINLGLAYVDHSTSEEIAEMKGTTTSPGVNSSYRSKSVSENRSDFDKMRSGDLKKCVLRAKIDMSHPNMIMRDPVLMRCIDTEHYRLGNTYKVYPMYDFAHPLSDLFEKISHSLCTLEFVPHRPLYNWVIENTIINSGVTPTQIEFNRLNIGHTILSKRKLNELIDNNLIDSLDDPRIPTIKGLKRRGYTPNSIRNFCEKVGWTKKDSLTDYNLLESCLRDELNKTADRLMGVSDPIKLTITNWDEIHKPTNRKLKDTMWLDIENNPEDEDTVYRTVAFNKNIWIERDDFKEVGNRKYHRLKLDGEVRLKGAYVVKAHDCIKDSNGEIIEVLCTADPNSKSGNSIDRKIKGTIHWVSQDFGMEAEFREYGKLFNDEKPNGVESFNKNSLIVKKGYVEPEALSTEGKPIQFMRKGYYILDEKDSVNDRLIFNKSVSLKEGW